MATRREKAKAIRSRDKPAQVESLANIGRTYIPERPRRSFVGVANVGHGFGVAIAFLKRHPMADFPGHRRFVNSYRNSTS
jgi:hypothetical protein